MSLILLQIQFVNKVTELSELNNKKVIISLTNLLRHLFQNKYFIVSQKLALHLFVSNIRIF